jgi:hypothetical protein
MSRTYNLVPIDEKHMILSGNAQPIYGFGSADGASITIKVMLRMVPDTFRSIRSAN